MRGEFVDIGGRRLYYYAAGSRGAGDPVVLLHGFPTSSRLWAPVVRDFPAGHRLVVVDLPGYGRSEGGVAAANGSGAAGGAAATIRALLDDLGVKRASIVGHGTGGGVAQALAVRWPERVSSLALVSTAAFGVKPRRMARLARSLGPLGRHTSPTLLAGLVHGGVRRGFVDPERSDRTLDACLAAFTSIGGRDALAAHLSGFAHCDTAVWTPRLSELRMPAAVIWGKEDPFYPVALGRRVAEMLPGATFEVIDGAAHFVPEDRPEELRRALVGLLARVQG
jgi:pimeloyl-ACP methyl ester carboxylesterase